VRRQKKKKGEKRKEKKRNRKKKKVQAKFATPALAAPGKRLYACSKAKKALTKAEMCRGRWTLTEKKHGGTAHQSS